MHLAMHGLAIPPGALLAQHGIAIMQSIMQFIGHEQHTGHMKHGFMQGRHIVIGQSHMHMPGIVRVVGEDEETLDVPRTTRS